MNSLKRQAKKAERYKDYREQMQVLEVGLATYHYEAISAEMREAEALLESLKDIEIVYHLAAMVGIGQSMYQIERFIDVNSLGTAKLLDIFLP